VEEEPNADAWALAVEEGGNGSVILHVRARPSQRWEAAGLN